VDTPDKLNLSAAQVAELQSTGRALEEAQKEVRSQKTDPQLLKELGMTFPQYQAFVEAYTDRFGKIKPMLEKTQRPGEALGSAFVLPGSRELQSGKGMDDKVGNVKGGEKLTPDQIKKLFESRAAKVPPEYRSAVEAYFRAVSEGTSTPAPTANPSK
jgi:hypothetical protein